MLPQKTITQLLQDWGGGQDSALEELIPRVYESLHQIAERRLRKERHGHTLQPTALINEVYLKLIDCREYDWVNRNKFYAICARLMRQILIDYARKRNALKHGGKTRRVPIDDARVLIWGSGMELDILDEALTGLAEFNKRQSQVVELRFFGGMTIEETAKALEVSPYTVKHDWNAAKSWLLDYISAKY